jgi:hypothetical protein
MSRKRQVSFPLRREHDVHFESLASLYAVARQNLSCITIRRPSSEDAAGCVRPPQGKYDRMQGRTYGSRVNQIWSALRGKHLQRRERQSARVSFPCFWGLALLVGRVSLRVLRVVEAALDKTRTPLTADTPARAFWLPRGQPGCV